MRKLKAVELVDSLHDIMQHAWEQLNITGEFRWLIKEKKDWSRKINPQRLEDKYYELHDLYANKTGGIHAIEKIMILMVKRLDARVRVGLGDKSAKNLVRLYSDMIDRLMESGDEVDPLETRMAVQQAYGQPVNPHTTSVAEFITIMNLVKKQAEAQRSKTKDNG